MNVAARLSPDRFHIIATGIPTGSVAGMREQGVDAGFGLRLVGENFHFAVFQRRAVVGGDGAEGLGAAVLAHFVSQYGVVRSVADRERAEHHDGDSFGELVKALHGSCPRRIVSRSWVEFPALLPMRDQS
jgi:hypothetical protein